NSSWAVHGETSWRLWLGDAYGVRIDSCVGCSERVRCALPRRSQEILEMGPEGQWHSRMHHKIRSRRRLMLQPRQIVVLNIIPLPVEQIEDIQRQQPVLGLLISYLQIEGGIGRGPRAVVFNERGIPEVPRTDRSKPPGRMLSRKRRVHDIRWAVRNVAARNGIRLGAPMGGIRVAAAKVIRLDVMIEARPGKGGVEVRTEPGGDSERVSPFNTGAPRCAPRLGCAGVSGEHQLAGEFQREHIQTRMPAR